MAKYEGWTIRTGFLAGNLFAESGDDRGTYDVDASAARYADRSAAVDEAMLASSPAQSAAASGPTPAIQEPCPWPVRSRLHAHPRASMAWMTEPNT